MKYELVELSEGINRKSVEKEFAPYYETVQKLNADEQTLTDWYARVISDKKRY